MQRPLWVIAAVSAAAVLLLAHPATAGTETDPEVADDEYDVTTATGGAPVCITTGSPQCAAGDGLDMEAAWFDNETAAFISINVSPMAASTSNQYTTNVHFKVGGVDYVASATLGHTASTVGAPGTTPGGVAANASLTGSIVTMIVPRSAIGDPAAGASITDIYVENFGRPLGQNVNLVTDRAPNTGVANRTYNFTLGPGAPVGTPGDVDGDFLNDTWEQENFGNLDQNATGDPDGDGCNNACEFQHGADPNNPDTDGDGVNDGDEVKSGTSPTVPNNTGTTTTTRPTTGGTPTTTTGGPPVTTTTRPPGGGGDRSLADRFQSALDSGYLIIAGALALVVIVLSIVGRAGRWKK